MTRPEDISQEVWDITREGLADATGIHPDFLNDNDIDVAAMCWHISEAIMAQIEKDAKIAEDRHKVWGTRDQTDGIEVEDDISACFEISAAIRSQAKESTK